MLLGGRGATSSYGERGGGGARSAHVTCFRRLLCHQWRHESWRHGSPEVGGQYKAKAVDYDHDDHDGGGHDGERQRGTTQSTTFAIMRPDEPQVCRLRLEM